MWHSACGYLCMSPIILVVKVYTAFGVQNWGAANAEMTSKIQHESYFSLVSSQPSFQQHPRSQGPDHRPKPCTSRDGCCTPHARRVHGHGLRPNSRDRVEALYLVGKGGHTRSHSDPSVDRLWLYHAKIDYICLLYPYNPGPIRLD